MTELIRSGRPKGFSTSPKPGRKGDVLFDRAVGRIKPEEFPALIGSVKENATVAVIVPEALLSGEARLSMSKNALFAGAVRLNETGEDILLFRKYSNGATEAVRRLSDDTFKSISFCDRSFPGNTYFDVFKDHTIDDVTDKTEVNALLDRFISNEALRRLKPGVTEAGIISVRNRYRRILTGNTEEDNAVLRSFRDLSGILETGQSGSVTNPGLGEITIDAGEPGKKGFGLKHIIEGRYEKNRLPENEITAILHLVKEAAEKGTPSVEQPKYIDGKNVGRIGIEKDGIIAFVSRERDGKDEKFIITGFALNKKKPEATETIQTVITRYGYTPEFSDIRNQVGAVIASINILSQTERDLSSNREVPVMIDILGKNLFFHIKNIGQSIQELFLGFSVNINFR